MWMMSPSRSTSCLTNAVLHQRTGHDLITLPTATISTTCMPTWWSSITSGGKCTSASNYIVSSVRKNSMASVRLLLLFQGAWFQYVCVAASLRGSRSCSSSGNRLHAGREHLTWSAAQKGKALLLSGEHERNSIV